MGKDKKHSLLWQLEHRAFSEPSFLFGTMHVKDKRAFSTLDLLYHKIDACSAFASEFNLEEAFTGLDPKYVLLPENQTLDQLIPPKKLHKIAKILKKSFRIELMNFLRYRPMMLTAMIDEQIFSQDRPFTLDRQLWSYAKSMEKEMLGIETYQEQIQIFQDIPIDYQVKILLAMSKNVRRHRKGLLRVADLYQQANLQQLYKSTVKGARGLKKLLIFDRNQLMANRIANLIAEQSVFCAIGAGHLPGAKGVLRLLKRKGFKVKPVKE